MKTYYISSILCAAALVLIAPTSTEAYFTTHQAASKITENAGIFAIQYVFGLEKHDIYMPIVAERDLPWENDEKKVGYSLTHDESDTTSLGTTTGLVLSTAPIVDGMYKIEKGTSAKMTLFVVLTTQDDAYETDYALQVDALPYYVDYGDEELSKLQLNPSELVYYTTKRIELNTGNYKE